MSEVKIDRYEHNDFGELIPCSDGDIVRHEDHLAATAELRRELEEVKEKLNWQNQPNRNPASRGGYEFYVNEEWTCIRDAAMDTDPGFHASLLKQRYDPDDERVRVRLVRDDDALLADLKKAEAERDALKREVEELRLKRIFAMRALRRCMESVAKARSRHSVRGHQCDLRRALDSVYDLSEHGLRHAALNQREK